MIFMHNKNNLGTKKMEAINKDVEHPEHYKTLVRFKEPECILFSQCLSFCLGNAFKYVWRAGKKGDPFVDLDKAAWYVRQSYSSCVDCSQKIENELESARRMMLVFFSHLDFTPLGEIGEAKEKALFSIILGNHSEALQSIEELKRKFGEL